MINGGDEVLGAVEPEGAVADRLDLVVHSLYSSVGESDPGPWQSSVQMGPQHTHESLERIELGSYGGCHPLLQMSFRPRALFVVPRTVERTLSGSKRARLARSSGPTWIGV